MVYLRKQRLKTHLMPRRAVGHGHTMPLRLSRRRRYTVYGVGCTLWLSGVLWLIFHYFMQHRGEFGRTPNPLEPWWLRLHAAAAFATLWTFGLVWGAHIVTGWRTGRHRITGSVAVAVLGWLILTGYLLYYLVDDQWRSVASLGHWSVGLSLPMLLTLHIVRGRRRRVARPKAIRPGEDAVQSMGMSSLTQ